MVVFLQLPLGQSRVGRDEVSGGRCGAAAPVAVQECARLQQLQPRRGREFITSLLPIIAIEKQP